MAEQIIIGQPVGAAPILPSVTLKNFGEDGYKRTTRLPINLAGTTIGKRGIVEGGFTPYTHEWELAPLEKEDVALNLEALVWWQQQQLLQRLDGRLVLQDEMDYVLPSTGTHPKTLVEGSTITVSTGCTTGYLIAKVILALPEQHKIHAGVSPSGIYGKRISVLAVEVLG